MVSVPVVVGEAGASLAGAGAVDAAGRSAGSRDEQATNNKALSAMPSDLTVIAKLRVCEAGIIADPGQA